MSTAFEFRQAVETFSEVLRFIDWKYSEEEIHKAIDFSEIGVLQRQEQDTGFREKPLKADSFFRAGRIGSWEDLIEENYAKLVYEKHKRVMDRFGYSVDKP